MASCRPVHALAALIAVASAACSIDVHSQAVSLREEKRFTVSSNQPVEVSVRTFDGAIQVRSWDKDEVLVEIERRAPDQSGVEALVVNASQEGNRVRIEVAQPRGERRVVRFGSCVHSVNVTVTTPRRITLEARTGDGPIDASELEGVIDHDSGDGRVVASRIAGRVRIHTGDGAIRIEEATRQVDAESGDGSIEIDGRLEGLTVRTGDGAVNVEATDGSVMKDDWRITTGDGGIGLRVPDRFNAEIDAHTGDGSIRVDGIDPPARQDRDGSDRRDLQGRLGSGGPVLRLRSGDGSIDVLRR
jgi:hypothetical protein